MSDEPDACPSCGGSGGGPFGRPGSAWDVETYVCPRCKGAGRVQVAAAVATPDVVARPLARAVAKPRPAEVTGATPLPAAAGEHGERERARSPGVRPTRPPARQRTKRRSSGA